MILLIIENILHSLFFHFFLYIENVHSILNINVYIY